MFCGQLHEWKPQSNLQTRTIRLKGTIFIKIQPGWVGLGRGIRHHGGMNVMFLPGLLCDARLWAAQAAEFPGSRIADLTLDDNLPAMAARLLADAPERFDLVALSMGGYLAFELLRQAPQRIRRMALLATSARADDPLAARRRRGLIGLARQHHFHGLSPRLLPNLLGPLGAKDAALGRMVMQMAAEVGREAFLRQQNAILHRPDSSAMLARITQPVLVGVGAFDQTTPPELGEEIAQGIPGARLHIFDHSGHLPPLEEPAAVSAVLRAFLA